jgi:hypothetical protein
MSQNLAILNHLRRGPLDPLTALRRYGTMRLAARISELREAGHKIVSERRHGNGKHYAVYRLC